MGHRGLGPTPLCLQLAADLDLLAAGLAALLNVPDAVRGDAAEVVDAARPRLVPSRTALRVEAPRRELAAVASDVDIEVEDPGAAVLPRPLTVRLRQTRRLLLADARRLLLNARLTDLIRLDGFVVSIVLTKVGVLIGSLRSKTIIAALPILVLCFSPGF